MPLAVINRTLARTERVNARSKNQEYYFPVSSGDASIACLQGMERMLGLFRLSIQTSFLMYGCHSVVINGIGIEEPTSRIWAEVKWPCQNNL